MEIFHKRKSLALSPLVVIFEAKGRRGVTVELFLWSRKGEPVEQTYLHILCTSTCTGFFFSDKQEIGKMSNF